MKRIIISTQEKLDKLKQIDKDMEVIIQGNIMLDHSLYVYGKLVIVKWNQKGNSTVVARDNSTVEVWDKSTVEARDNSIVVARDNSTVVAWDKSTVEARDNSIVVALDKSTVIAKDNSTVEVWDKSTVEARDKSTVIAKDNSTVVAWDNSIVVAKGKSTVEAWDNSVIRINSLFLKYVKLYGYSVVFKPFDYKINIMKLSEYAKIQHVKSMRFFKRNGVKIKYGKCILFKRVSKEFKTQEGTKNETTWSIGEVLVHKKWRPKSSECGKNKYHACSKPYFCDEFRNEKGDVYIAIECCVKDTYEWENPTYSHKISFRKGKVLYECDRMGKQIK